MALPPKGRSETNLAAELTELGGGIVDGDEIIDALVRGDHSGLTKATLLARSSTTARWTGSRARTPCAA